jgi:predicted ArsR family transcriptional regulator
MNLTNEERAILLALAESEPAELDEIVTRVGLPVRAVKGTLRELRAKGLVNEAGPMEKPGENTR